MAQLRSQDVGFFTELTKLTDLYQRLSALKQRGALSDDPDRADDYVGPDYRRLEAEFLPPAAATASCASLPERLLQLADGHASLDVRSLAVDCLVVLPVVRSVMDSLAACSQLEPFIRKVRWSSLQTETAAACRCLLPAVSTHACPACSVSVAQRQAA